MLYNTRFTVLSIDMFAYREEGFTVANNNNNNNIVMARVAPTVLLLLPWFWSCGNVGYKVCRTDRSISFVQG